MTSEESAEVTVEIRLRHLDSDEKSVEVAPANGSASPGERRNELRRLVEVRYPDARLKSFDGFVASFVTATHLVVASYLNPEALEVQERPESKAEQPSLFPKAA